MIPFGQGPVVRGHKVAQLPVIRNKQIEAVKQYASVLFPATELIGLPMDLTVPKGGFRHVSEFMTHRGATCTAAMGLPFPHTLWGYISAVRATKDVRLLPECVRAIH